MKRRLSVVLALAMVFSLVLSSVVMAAPEGNKISNELQLTVTVQDIEGATIGVNPDLALTSAVGLYDCFTVSTTPGGHEGETVKVKLGSSSSASSSTVTSSTNLFDISSPSGAAIVTDENTNENTIANANTNENLFLTLHTSQLIVPN